MDGLTSGVGPSTPTAIENIHGMEFERPARRAHETIELIQRLTSTEEDRIDYDGELISVKGVPTLERDIPIYFAALGPANRRVVVDSVMDGSRLVSARLGS